MTAATTSYSLETRTTAAITASLQTGDIHLIDELAVPWERLCEESSAEIFLTPEWIRCYLQAFEPETKLVVISVWAGERLLAILPLTHKWIWFRGIRLLELRGAANAHTIQFDLLRVPGAVGEAAVAEVWRCLRDFPDWHVLHLPYLPENGTAREIMGCATIDGFANFCELCADSPFVSMQRDKAGSVNIFAHTTSKFRRELGRRAKLLEAELGHERKLMRISSGEPEALAPFFELEAAGWKGRAGTAIDSSHETSAFYREIAQMAERRGAFSLYMLHVGKQLIAASFGVQSGNTFHILKVAYDERLSRFGPGHLLTMAVLADCVDRGLVEVSFGGKDEAYKKDWTRDVHRSSNGYIFNNQLRSRVVFYEKSYFFPELRRAQRRITNYLVRFFQFVQPRNE